MRFRSCGVVGLFGGIVGGLLCPDTWPPESGILSAYLPVIVGCDIRDDLRIVPTPSAVGCIGIANVRPLAAVGIAPGYARLVGVVAVLEAMKDVATGELVFDLGELVSQLVKELSLDG